MASRIEIVEPCEHGETRPCGKAGWSYSDGEVTYRCPGGSRRVIDPGSFVLIEKVDGEWPEWIEDEDFKLQIHEVMRRLFINFAPIWRNTSAASHQHPNYAPSLVSEILDALAGAES